jgi:hypothetical protein
MTSAKDYLGVGTSVGFSIILPLLLISYVFDGSIFILVSFFFLYNFKQQVSCTELEFLNKMLNPGILESRDLR